MKTLFIFAFLAVAALAEPEVSDPVILDPVIVGPEFFDTETSGSGASGRLNVGRPVPGERVLRTGTLFVHPASHAQQRDFIFTADGNTRISTVRAWEVGPSQGAVARIVRGGPSQREVIVRAHSQHNRGFHFQVQVSGR